MPAALPSCAALQGVDPQDPAASGKMLADATRLAMSWKRLWSYYNVLLRCQEVIGSAQATYTVCCTGCAYRVARIACWYEQLS